MGAIQSGIISGKKQYIDKIYKNSMYRTLRLDKYRVAILEKILRTYVSNTRVLDDNISIYFFNRSIDKLKDGAKSVIKKIDQDIHKKNQILIELTTVEAGSGSLPTEKIDSLAITITSDTSSANKISKKLRTYSIPIITYVKDNKVYIDFKAIHENQYHIISTAINQCL